MRHGTRIAIGQLCSSSSLSKNLNTITRLITRAIDQDVKLIFFPEASDFISRNASHSQYLAQGTQKFINDLQLRVKSLVREKSKPIDILIGVHIPSSVDSKDKRTKNVLLYINHEGKILDTYQKLHLFDVDIKNGPILKESISVQPGTELPKVIETPVGKVGTAICYDIRFPEHSLYLRSKGAEIICFPSAFTMKTGAAHWELLGRARAIDTQCYIVMPGQQGVHDIYDDDWNDGGDVASRNAKRESWGHSIIIDPWGEIIAKCSSDNDPQLIVADLDFDQLNNVRGNMPLMNHRRNDIFK